MDKEIEKDIINCSRCGLCMDVCPVYKAKKTETFSLRGKFLQILGLVKKDLKYDRKISYNLDLCLGCKKCKSACPSGLDAVKIFSAVRAEFQSPFEKFFYSAPVFKFKIFALRLIFKFNRKKTKKNFPPKVGYFKGCVTRALSGGKGEFACCALPFYVKGRMDLYEKYKNRNMKLFEKYEKIVFDCATCYDTVLNYEGIDKSKLVYFTDFYKNKTLSLKKTLKIAFHKPCHLNSETYKSIIQILKSIKNLEYVEFDEQEECCGFGGDFFTRHAKTAIFLSKRKIKAIIEKKADIVLTTCPTCLWSLKFGIKAYRNKELTAYDLSEFLEMVDNSLI